MDDDRKLSEADAKAIAAELEKALMQRLYLNAGKGVLAWAWNKAVTVMLLAALYWFVHSQGWLAAVPPGARGG